jgi:hypothetical protein
LNCHQFLSEIQKTVQIDTLDMDHKTNAAAQTGAGPKEWQISPLGAAAAANKPDHCGSRIESIPKI